MQRVGTGERRERLGEGISRGAQHCVVGLTVDLTSGMRCLEVTRENMITLGFRNVIWKQLWGHLWWIKTALESHIVGWRCRPAGGVVALYA